MALLLALLRLAETPDWIQTAPAEAAVFIRNFCIDPDYQRLGIGSAALRLVIDEAWENGDAVTLGVAKGSPARRFYERLRFHATHSDIQHDYMRRAAGPASEPAW